MQTYVNQCLVITRRSDLAIGIRLPRDTDQPLLAPRPSDPDGTVLTSSISIRSVVSVWGRERVIGRHAIPGLLLLPTG